MGYIDKYNVREWFERIKSLANGLTTMQMATLARVVAVILLVIAIYNCIKLFTYL